MFEGDLNAALAAGLAAPSRPPSTPHERRQNLRQRPELRRGVLHTSSTRIATPCSQANRLLANGGDIAAACREMGVPESTGYRLRPCAPGNDVIVFRSRWIGSGRGGRLRERSVSSRE